MVELRLGDAVLRERDVGQHGAHEGAAVRYFESLEQIRDEVAHGGLDGEEDTVEGRPVRHGLRDDGKPERRAGRVRVGPLCKGLEDVLALHRRQRAAEEVQQVLEHLFRLADGLDLDQVLLVAEPRELGPQDRQALEFARVVRQRRHHEAHVRRQIRHWQPVETPPGVGVVELVHGVDEER